jgi:hypothetical protein
MSEPTFAARRALCPTCGAPIPLDGTAARATCAYCGTVAQVERRLRRTEPANDPAARTLELDWKPSHLLDGGSDRATCWGCGAMLEIAADQAIVTCAACGCVSKVERRLAPVEPPLRLEEGEDAGTVRVLERLARATDLAERISIAKGSLDTWGSVNDTMAGRVGEVLALLETADPRLAHAAGEVVGKLLCSDEPLHRAAVLAAGHSHLFHARASRVLLWHLGLGPGICLKPLLDAASAHGERGDLDRAGTALWAATTLLGRNYPDHPTLAKVILYRLIYLRGALLGWALRFLHGQDGIGYRYATPVLLDFLDDVAAERPALVREVRRAIRDAAIENESDYRSRLDLYAKLVTPEAKAALLELLPPPPKGTALRTAKAAYALLVGALDEPGLAPSATRALARHLEDGVPAAIQALVRERKDALPEELRRAYLKKVPDSPDLSPLPPKYWEPERPEPRAPEVEEAERLYKEAISRAVELWNREAESLRRYSDLIRDRTPLMVAAGSGDLDAIAKLLRGSDVDARNPAGRTALMFAAESGHSAAVQALGGDRALRDSEGKTAIVLAAEAGHADAVRALLGDESLAQEAFRAAFQNDHPEVMRLLLGAGADPDALEEDGSTPLMACARDGRLELARLLVDAGADLEHRDGSGKNAVDHARAGGRAEVIALLESRGAS